MQYTGHPMISRHYIYRNKVSPLPLHTGQEQQPPQPYKTIRQEANEFKAKMRAMRLEREAASKAQKPPTKRRRRKPEHPRNSRLHKEPSRFIGVLKEGWNFRVELFKYHLSGFMRTIVPTLFCLKAEVEDGAYESSHRGGPPENE